MTADIYTLKTGDLRDDQPADDEYGPLIESIYSLLNEQLMEIFTDMLDDAEQTVKEYSAAVEDAEEEGEGKEERSEKDDKKTQKIAALRILSEKRKYN